MKMKKFSLTLVLTVFCVCFVCLADVSAANCEQPNAEPVAEEVIGSSGVTWLPKVSFNQLILSVSRPDGTIFSKTFDLGSTPYFDLSGNTGDGLYSYELRAIPMVTKKVRSVEGLSGVKESTLPQKALVQTGSFSVQGGSVVLPGAPEGVDKPMDVLHYDDVIITGSLCVGWDCANGESFGYCTIKLKENNLQLCFEDTSVGSFPTNDWKIQINDTTSGGASYFTLWDTNGGRRPFTIEAGAPAHSLYVEDYGRVGLGTSIPYVELHIVDGDSPTIRLDQDGSSGWTAQRWDLCGNETNFFIRDVTNGSKLCFRIQPNTPSNTLCMRSTGNVGIGTWSPAYPLEVETTGEAARIVCDRTDGATTQIFASETHGFFGTLSSHPTRITTNGTYRIEFAATTNLITTASGATCTTTGQWQSASSRALKENIRALSVSEAIAALNELNPVKYNYKADKDEEDVGFIAEDVPDLVATKSRKTMSAMDVVAVLTKVVQEQQKTISELKKEITELKKK
jgi:hypothetical protein